MNALGIIEHAIARQPALQLFVAMFGRFEDLIGERTNIDEFIGRERFEIVIVEFFGIVTGPEAIEGFLIGDGVVIVFDFIFVFSCY